MKLDALKRLYFIGIGGIGMSALARYFNQRGAEIHGYDKTETALTKKLVSEGMKIHFEDDIAKIPEQLDAVVYTPAIPGDHQELNHLMASDIPVMKRSEMLGVISRAKKCIAVAGTHGKTTTSSMTAHLLKHSGMDISCFLGGIANNFESNYCYGESEWTVIEADEFDRSFHRLSPEIAVLISMDPDHLDIYGEKNKMQESFEIFLLKVNEGGKVIIQQDLIELLDDGFLKKLKDKRVDVFTYGGEEADFKISNLRFEEGRQVFDQGDLKDVSLMMPGLHNTLNMCAAMAVARILEIEKEQIKAGVKTFSGIKRRFEIFEGGSMVYVDDYAHHPSELRAAIGSARSLWPDREMTVIFQPHLFSRTRDFLSEFGDELSKVDELLLMDIYPAREKPIPGINSERLLETIDLKEKKVVKREDLMKIIKGKKRKLIMTLGAGDIDVFAPEIRSWIKEND
ncbi:UDP-N-acetylmuramate--L-alanine ligase [Portibacter marinus]|uniref:UDP-N-acetylmuramate--L-alanine ligase n=1 Tax=Portibacter marinus TaxID=2898660 RepID=UPI001F334288|nr:UDP-N-acetylmuramate--L-alanine ligase [Portibacter marinus]